MTTQQELDAAMEPVRVRLAQEETALIMINVVGPLAERTFHRPPSDLVVSCGDQGQRLVWDWECPSAPVRCLDCTRAHFGSVDGDAHWNEKLMRCWVCGDVFSLAPVLPRVQFAWLVPATGNVVLRGVEMVEGTPVAWVCPRHDAAVADPVVRVRPWRG